MLFVVSLKMRIQRGFNLITPDAIRALYAKAKAEPQSVQQQCQSSIFFPDNSGQLLVTLDLFKESYFPIPNLSKKDLARATVNFERNLSIFGRKVNDSIRFKRDSKRIIIWHNYYSYI
jgi:hypothetical protein